MDLSHLPPLVYALAAVAGVPFILAWRFRETNRPVTVKSIIAPPLGMSTGLFMFVAPATRVPWSWAGIAVVLGATLFAIPLERSSTLTKEGGRIFMTRSKAFLWLLLGLVAVRFALRSYVEQHVSPLQTGALFFLLALGAVVRWRVGMLRQYFSLSRVGRGAEKE